METRAEKESKQGIQAYNQAYYHTYYQAEGERKIMSITKKLPLGICEWNLPIGGLSGIRMAADAGFDGIQIHEHGGYASNFPLDSPYTRQAYLEASEAYHVELQTLHLRALALEGQMLYEHGAPEYDVAKLSIDKGIAACAALKIPTLFLSSFFATFINSDYQLKNFAGLLGYAREAASEKGISVAYETALPYSRLCTLLELAGGGVEILYDFFNPLFYGIADPIEEIPLLGGKISQVHVKDRLSNYRDSCLLCDGVGKIEKSAQLLKEMNWSGWVVNETSHHLIKETNGKSPFELLQSDLERMKALFNW